ncbi:type II toxin-antitoxin system RelE/ParE family toxin [Rhizobium sp. TH2]|uniref:type II toxin-antitoxin system RelE/ParE family toxin n=1 Tax=Rhizobium sp. TH2 TaxID=2775403 RepID=UPI002157C891|nr:type II toxin-antitoxin system RelE/ParE family toxin [Rhizobium sp. TH2]UVC08710.1 type II toxin-antitoxin system RelE/ParE family toxin [Rhizobium sp. TH2]
MAFEVIRSLDSDQDLRIIIRHLVESYVNLGDPLPDAIQRAAARARKIEAALDSIAIAPHQGTLLPQLAPGLRSVTKESAVFYFDVDEAKKTVCILAIFFGGQDHRQHMLRRLSSTE